MKVAILYPGEMGTTVAHALLQNNHEVYWVSTGRSNETRNRAEAIKLKEIPSINEAAKVVDVFISICRGGGVFPNAEEVVASGFTGLYVDANYVGSKEQESFLQSIISRAGIDYVEASIYGWPYPDKTSQSTERTIYLTGDSAGTVSTMLAGSIFNTVVTTDAPTAKDIKRQRESEDKKVTLPHTNHGNGVVEFYNLLEINEDFVDKWIERRRLVEPHDYTIDSNGFYINRGGYKFTEAQVKGAPERYLNLTPEGCPSEDVEFHANLERVMFYCINAYSALYPESKDCLWWRSDAHVAMYGVGAGMGMHHDNAIGGASENENPLYNVVSGSFIIRDTSVGGELAFRFIDTKLKPKPGSAVLYPSSFMGSHSVTQITEGTRISYLEFFGHGSRPGQTKKL